MWSLSQLPRVGHHQFKHVVSIHGHRHGLVVLAELVKGDDSVRILAVPLRHEVGKHLVRVLLALLHVGVLRRVIDLSNVTQGHLSVLVHVKLFVSRPHQLSPCVIHWVLDGSEEFIEANSAIFVSVEVGQ